MHYSHYVLHVWTNHEALQQIKSLSEVYIWLLFNPKNTFPLYFLLLDIIEVIGLGFSLTIWKKIQISFLCVLESIEL